MPIFKEKTPNQKLFNAVAKANVKKVREALEAGANVNEISTSNMTPLDVVARDLESYNGFGGLCTASSFNTMMSKMHNLKLVWNELVMNGGSLSQYRNTGYNNGFSFAPHFKGIYMPEMEFATPKAPKQAR